jgi:hypothetical protein
MAAFPTVSLANRKQGDPPRTILYLVSTYVRHFLSILGSTVVLLNLINIADATEKFYKPSAFLHLVGIFPTIPHLAKLKLVRQSLLKLNDNLFFIIAVNWVFFQFLTVPMFRNVSMKCLTEIAGVTVTHYDDKFIGKLSQWLLGRLIMSARGTLKSKANWTGGIDS